MILKDYLVSVNTELEPIISNIADVCTLLCDKIKLIPFYGSDKIDTTNVHGEEQTSLDLYANDIFLKSLVDAKIVGSVVSEEIEHIIIIDENMRYNVSIDPIDGCSNIDLNILSQPNATIVALRKVTIINIIAINPRKETKNRTFVSKSSGCKGIPIGAIFCIY